MAGVSMDMRIEGAEELARKMEPGKLLNSALKKLLTAAAMVVVRKSKEKASGRPGPMVQTGRLRSSITHKLDPASTPLFAKVGTEVFYGKFLEEGTSKMPPYPFLKPALEESQSKINSLLKDAANDIEDNYKK